VTVAPNPTPLNDCPTVVRDADGCPIGINWQRAIEEEQVTNA
jgi:succinate dehydrogenase/fumarate reductase-like Fe-S protein